MHQFYSLGSVSVKRAPGGWSVHASSRQTCAPPAPITFQRSPSPTTAVFSSIARSSSPAGTAFWSGVLEGLDHGLAYGGCSAGIQCLGERALDSTVRPFGPEVWKPGLGLFRGVWFGPHWDALDRYVPGLSDLIRGSVPAGELLLAIDENSAVVGDGERWKVMGSGGAHVWREDAWTDHPPGARFTLVLPRG